MILHKLILLFTTIVVFNAIGIGQDLENLSAEEIKARAKAKLKEKLKDPIQFSGGINATSTYYQAYGMEANRDPFIWQVGINLNFKLFNTIDVPFSALINSKQFGVKLPGVPPLPSPPTTFGLSPKYKAFTLHLGYRNINLSEFSLNGSQFLGVGLEVSPKNSFVKGKVLYGRFAKAILFNLDGTIATLPSFQRYGWGTGITLGKSPKNEVTFNIFKAKDDPNSLAIDISDLVNRPADNLVLGIATKQTINKKLSFEGEIDYSLLTNDIEVQEQVGLSGSYLNNIFLLETNTTTSSKKAMLFSGNYKTKNTKHKLKYRRVDPDYRTLGTSYINSDYEDISLKSSIGLLKKKLTLGLTVGLQRNNLDKDRAAQLLRLIGGVDATYLINDKWTLSSNYSNFNSQTRQTIVLTVDSLYFSQITQSVAVNLIRVSNSDNVNQSLSLSFNYQDAVVNSVKETSFYNGAIGWQNLLVKSKTRLVLSLVAFHNVTLDQTISNIGPSIMVGKNILKDKLKLNLTSAYLPTFLNLEATGSVTNISLSGMYSLAKKHKKSFSVADIMKEIPQVDNTTEITATISYNYTF